MSPPEANPAEANPAEATVSGATLSSSARRPLFPMIALTSVVVLLVVGVLMAAFNERLYAQQKTREAAVQAAILADTVSAALIFDDATAAQDSVDALTSNPEIAAVGVYDERGRLMARLLREGEALPERPRLQAPAFEHGRLTLTIPVNDKTGDRLGVVHLRLLVEPTWRRLGRYAGVALLIGMAAVVLAVLGVSQSALSRANTALRGQAADLVETNRQLQEQMEERVRAEEALRQAQRLEAMGRLTGGVAHDFNNLLMVASSGLDLLDRTEDPERREKLKAGIRQAMERGAALTSQLLAFSRRSALKPRVVDLAARIEAMRVLLERSLREDITVEVDLPPDLWPVEIDDNEFELALLNIAVNARDAMPDGGSIIIGGENVGAGGDGPEDNRDHIRLTISDTGVGMSPEVAARVFEPFFTTKAVGKGTGLGLSQVYGFARSSGGEVHIVSDEGEGATVVLTLPRSTKALSELATAPTGTSTAKARGRVLMVEDDDEVAAMVDQMLDSLGYRVARAADAESALKTLEADARFDLVFSDMVMPGDMDGRSLVREVQRRYPKLPVLLTTGYSEAAALATSEGLRLLPKPYRIDALADAIRSARADYRRTANQRRGSAA
jgi:signal transduction histidine kinase/ActR/RegA family two-component response regulator